MIRFLPEYPSIAILAAIVLSTTLVFGVELWYVSAVLILIFAGVYTYTYEYPDRGFYILCSGIPLVIECGLLSLWAGLLAGCGLAVVTCSALGILKTATDRKNFLIFCGIAFIVALVTELTNHVLLPLLVFSIAAGVVILVRSVKRYQIQKEFTGAKP
jgi:hypothetical protein